MTMKPAINPGAIYTVQEASALLSIAAKVLREKLRAGVVVGSRRIGQWRIRGSELLKLA